MIKLFGYLFTLFYWAGIFFPSVFSVSSTLAGHLALGLFALLVARGARRTSNHFLYFVRLLAAAITVEFILFLSARHLRLWFEGPNLLFTYTASLSLIAGLSMVIGCYRDMVAQAIPAGGKFNRKILFGQPVNPGNYRMAPAVGLIVGLLTAGLSIFVTLYFHFSGGLFALLFILLAFIAMDDEETQASRKSRSTLFLSRRELSRTLLFTVILVFLSLAWLLVTEGLSSWTQVSYLAAVGSILPAALLPEFPRRFKNSISRRLTYAVMPAMLVLLFIMRIVLT